MNIEVGLYVKNSVEVSFLLVVFGTDNTEDSINITKEENDMNDFIFDLLERIEEKCDYGYNISVLNQKERVFYVTQQLEMKVNNVGFSQFFVNKSGDFAGEIVAAYNEIGAKKTSKICDKAIKAIGKNVPTDWDARQDLLEKREIS